jgi:two-component system cell cycle sensor histidine kinase PleC
MVNVNNIRAANDARLKMETVAQQFDDRELSGHAKLFAKPRYRRLENAEPVLKRSIPVLILTFLLFVALARSITVYEHYERYAGVSEQATNLTLTAMSATISANPVPAANGERWNTEAQINKVLDQYAIEQGRIIAVADEKGYIFASSAIGQDFVGKSLTTLLGETSPLQLFGTRAGVQALTLGDDSGVHAKRDMFVGLTFLPNQAGSILVMSPQAPDLLTWFRKTVSLNVTLFIATAAILIMILYAYFIQVGHTKDANEIYAESQRRVDMALSRGRCGLWEWDMAQSRLFWSSSMYEMRRTDASRRW